MENEKPTNFEVSQTDKPVNKSATELETESIDSKIRVDTISSKSRGYIFGMTKEDIYNRSKILLDSNQIVLYTDSTIAYRFPTENFTLWNYVRFSYYKGKLWRTTESVLPKKNELLNDNRADFKEEVLTDIINYYGEPYQNGTLNSDYFWLKGNLRVDYIRLMNGEGDSTAFVIYSDMITERKMIKDLDSISKIEQEKELEKDLFVINKIKEIAKKDWPEDYSTQEYWINEQMKAYEYMKQIPDDKIKRKAERDWPYDFTTQKYWYNEQLEAKERIK
jgi:hypothetical protein